MLIFIISLWKNFEEGFAGKEGEGGVNPSPGKLGKRYWRAAWRMVPVKAPVAQRAGGINGVGG